VLEISFPPELDKVEEVCRALYVSSELVECDIRKMELDPDKNCLTIELDLAHFESREQRDDFDSVAQKIREQGFVVDELLQDTKLPGTKPLRYWLIVYLPNEITSSIS
jgi:hypothetical protein